MPEWIAEEIDPLLNEALAADALEAKLRIDGDKVFIDYEATTEGSGYVAPSVMLEFGARSTESRPPFKSSIATRPALLMTLLSRLPDHA